MSSSVSIFLTLQIEPNFAGVCVNRLHRVGVVSVQDAGDSDILTAVSQIAQWAHDSYPSAKGLWTDESTLRLVLKLLFHEHRPFAN